MQSKRGVFNLSSFLSKSSEYFNMQTKATYWFGAVLSLIEESEKKQLNDDTNVSDKAEIIKILSCTISSMLSFYEQQRPNSVFKLFNFAGNLFELLVDCREYHYIVAKISYLNTLALYSIKTHQYSYSLDVFGDILEIYNQNIIDNVNEFFLSAFSNYLAFLKKSHKKLTSRMLEIEAILKDLFFKYFTKIMLQDKTSFSEVYLNSIVLLTGVYRQNYGLFSKFEKDINSLITHVYQHQLKLKRKLPDDMVDFVLRQKLKKHISVKIYLNQDELKFYSAIKNKFRRSIQMKREEQDTEKQRLSKIQSMLCQSIQILNQQKLNNVRYATLQQRQWQKKTQKNDINYSTIQSVQLPKAPLQSSQMKLPTHSLQPLPRSITKRRQIISKPIIKQKMMTRHAKAKFKLYTIFIEVNEEGVLLCDQTNENKRYIEWNTLSLIIQKIDLQFPFEQFLKIPMCNFYDFVRIIAFYLKKNDNREICLLSKPVPLLQVNQLIKLYKQEGKYLKLALMNRYDTQKFVGVIDIYISEYDEFFKTLTQNQYILHLNQRISSKNSQSLYDRQNCQYHIDYVKRKRKTTVTELNNQLQTELLEVAIEEKGCLYKCIFFLKNNSQLIVKIIDNIKNVVNLQDYIVEIKIQNLKSYSNSTFYLQSENDSNVGKSSQKINKTIQIPLYRLANHIPLYGLAPKDYIMQNGRMIIDCLNYFQQFSRQINLGGLNFNMITHVCRTEMIEYGKYYSVVSAELVGSRERVWALVIRFYDLGFMRDNITLMMNPYNDFLQDVITSSREEQQVTLKNLLIGGSVRETVGWLKKSGKLEKRMNLFEYLGINKLI